VNLRQVIVQVLAPSPVLTARWRRQLYRAAGLRISSAVRIESRSLVKTQHFTVGSGTFINHGIFVDRGSLDIGQNVAVGPGVRFLTTTHEVAGPLCRAGAALEAPIVVGDGVWIGACATVVGPSKVASGCVIAAGAVVVGDTAPNGLYAGVPARRIRELSAE